MSWFDKLKGIFNVEINSPILAVTINKNSNNDSSSKYTYDPETKKLDLHLDKLERDEQEKLSEVIEAYTDEGNLFLEEGTLSLLENLYNYHKENKDNQVLNFFKLIIPADDLEALENALFLRKVFLDKKQCLSRLKQDIVLRFGERGRNIANLCTAGYFEEFFIPLYNSSKEQFIELYEVIISKSVVAVFVNPGMFQDEIQLEITSKINISKKYGIKFIHIHGIGYQNIRKIKECLEEKKEFFRFFQKNLYEKDNIMIVELLFLSEGEEKQFNFALSNLK